MDVPVLSRTPAAMAGELAAWVVPHRLWEARHRWRQLRSGGCPPRHAARIALSGRKTNALVNTRLDLLPGGALATIRVAVDVGANIGDWTAGLLEVLDHLDLVQAYEPSPQVFPVVSRRFAGRADVTVIQAAVGDHDGTTPFYVTEHSHNASVLSPRTGVDELLDGGGVVKDRVDVDMVSLDTALAALDRIDLLKIDVQGFEQSVLAGARATLDKVSWVLIEANFVSLYEGDLLLPELHALMVDAGFELANLSKPYVRKGRAMFSDALYRHVGR